MFYFLDVYSYLNSGPIIVAVLVALLCAASLTLYRFAIARNFTTELYKLTAVPLIIMVIIAIMDTSCIVPNAIKGCV